MKLGFVVGKFVPFHKGHEFLIRTALEQCDQVMLLSYTSNNHGFSAVKRKAAIFRQFAEEVVSDRLRVCVGDVGAGQNKMDLSELHFFPSDDADDFLHRKFCGDFLDRVFFKPDVVFTSEKYGDGLAGYISGLFDQAVEHVCVDLERKTYPISATMIRTGQVDPKEWSLM